MKASNLSRGKQDGEGEAPAPGDFIGFPVNGSAHAMLNSGSTDLVDMANVAPMVRKK